MMKVRVRIAMRLMDRDEPCSLVFAQVDAGIADYTGTWLQQLRFYFDVNNKYVLEKLKVCTSTSSQFIMNPLLLRCEQ